MPRLTVAEMQQQLATSLPALPVVVAGPGGLYDVLSVNADEGFPGVVWLEVAASAERRPRQPRIRQRRPRA